jgi:hypothetical protein
MYPNINNFICDLFLITINFSKSIFVSVKPNIHIAYARVACDLAKTTPYNFNKITMPP